MLVLQSLLALNFDEILIEINRSDSTKISQSELMAQLKRLEGLIYMDEDEKYRLTRKGLNTAQSML